MLIKNGKSKEEKQTLDQFINEKALSGSHQDKLRIVIPGDKVTAEDKKLAKMFTKRKEVEKSQDELNNEKRLTYNENITELDEMYSSFKPNGLYLVRYYVATGETKKGIGYIPHDHKLYYKNHAQTEAKAMPDPIAPLAKAVVVSAPSKHAPFQSGSIISTVGIESRLVNPLAPGSGVDVNCSWIHPDSGRKTIPTSADHRHFGYALISPQQVVGEI